MVLAQMEEDPMTAVNLHEAKARLAELLRHTLAVERLPWHHRDAFDRLLVATCLVDSLTRVIRDPVFDAYSIRTRW